MDRKSRSAAALISALVISQMGCAGLRFPDFARGGQIRTELEGVQLLGVVEDVDQKRGAILLRATVGGKQSIQYGPQTVVVSRNREVPIDGLRPDDLVLVQVKRSPSGELYTDLIHLRERAVTGLRR